MIDYILPRRGPIENIFFSFVSNVMSNVSYYLFQLDHNNANVFFIKFFMDFEINQPLSDDQS